MINRMLDTGTELFALSILSILFILSKFFAHFKTYKQVFRC
jgi:hypothetical protein